MNITSMVYIQSPSEIRSNVLKRRARLIANDITEQAFDTFLRTGVMAASLNICEAEDGLRQDVADKLEGIGWRAHWSNITTNSAKEEWVLVITEGQKK